MPATPGDNAEYRRAWSRFATGVTVITSVEPDGAPHGMTANGVTSVSLAPPLALVSVAHTRNTYRHIAESGRFGISVLEARQLAVAEHFAMDPAVRGSCPPSWYGQMDGGHPVIDGALSSFICEIVSAHDAGDHTIFVGRVTAFETRDGEPLIWYESGFGELRSGG